MDIMTLLTNLSSSYQPIYALMMDICLIAGFAMVLIGLNMMRPVDQYSKGPGSSPRGGLWSIGIGSALAFFPSTVDMVTQTFFAMDAQSLVFAYDSQVGTASNPFAPIKGFIQLFGVFSFMNGLFTLRAVGVHGNHGNKSYKSAVVWLLAGMAMINIDRIVSALAVSTGLSNVGVTI